MKITVNKKEEKQELIDWRKFPRGTVIEFDDKVRAVVFEGKKSRQLVLLTYSDGGAWFERAIGYKNEPVAKVLGTISEIVVNE